MDVKPITSKAEMWVFAEELPQEGILVEVVDVVQRLSKNKNNFEALLCLGKSPNGKYVGDLLVGSYKLRATDGLLTAYGQKAENWKGKLLRLIPNEEKTLIIAGI